jgi:hypothetical protein
VPKKITIKLKNKEADDLIKLLETQKIEFSTCEEGRRFLPSPWKEIVVMLTPVLLNILYDFWKTRKGKGTIIVKIDGASMELDADNIKKLELIVKKEEETKFQTTSK